MRFPRRNPRNHVPVLVLPKLGTVEARLPIYNPWQQNTILNTFSCQITTANSVALEEVLDSHCRERE